MRDLLGGKGADVAEMTRMLGADLVPGRVHDHDRGLRRVHARRRQCPDGPGRRRSPRRSRGSRSDAGKRLGDAEDPLLVSVRSGARESMPGMMDTVLNLGLNDDAVEGLAARTGNERFAWDSYRRFVQMFGNVVAASRASASRTRSRRVKQRPRRDASTPTSTSTRCAS